MGDVYVFVIGLFITLMVSAAFVLLMYGAADKTPPLFSGEQSGDGNSSGARQPTP